MFRKNHIFNPGLSFETRPKSLLVLLMARKRKRQKGKPADSRKSTFGRSSSSKGLKKKRRSRAAYMREYRKRRKLIVHKTKYKMVVASLLIFGMGVIGLNILYYYWHDVFFVLAVIWLAIVAIALDVVGRIGSRICIKYSR